METYNKIVEWENDEGFVSLVKFCLILFFGFVLGTDKNFGLFIFSIIFSGIIFFIIEGFPRRIVYWEKRKMGVRNR